MSFILLDYFLVLAVPFIRGWPETIHHPRVSFEASVFP